MVIFDGKYITIDLQKHIVNEFHQNNINNHSVSFKNPSVGNYEHKPIPSTRFIVTHATFRLLSAVRPSFMVKCPCSIGIGFKSPPQDWPSCGFL